MTTQEEVKRSVEYSRIVTSLLALREEVRVTSHEEAEAIDRIITDLMGLQLYDRYIAENGIPLGRK